jgi:hypothetical protein
MADRLDVSAFSVTGESGIALARCHEGALSPKRNTTRTAKSGRRPMIHLINQRLSRHRMVF